MGVFINSRFLTQNKTGVQRFACEISIRLKKLYPQACFLAPKNVIDTKTAQELDVELFGSFTGHLWEQIELPCYLTGKRNPLLVNLANTAPIFYSNQISTIHDLAFLENPEWFSKLFSYFYGFLIPRVAKRSKKIITVSAFSKKEIVRLLKVPEQKIEVIHNAFSEVLCIDKNIDKNRHGNYILAVSSIDPRKNLKRLIEAYNHLCPLGVKLVIVGPKNSNFANSRIEDLANKNIILKGYVNDEELGSLYRHAKLLVYPSLYEGFGLPPLEAMACGCPVIVSNVASLPEVCGDAAYYVNPYDVENISEGIYKVLSDENLRHSLIQKGLDKIKMFSWEKSAKEYIKVFEEILDSTNDAC